MDNYQNDRFLQKRNERQRKMRKRRRKIILIFILVLLLLLGAVLSVTVLFPIKNITASGSKIYSSAQIVNACGIKKDDNLIIVSSSKTLDKLKQKLPFIDTVELERSLPDSINIKVTDAKEYACYKVGGNYFTVSKDGWVLKSYTERPPNLMLIITDKVKCKVGNAIQFTEPDLDKQCDSILNYLKKYNISVDYVDITDKMAIEAKVSGRFLVNFGSIGDFESKVKHLVGMMKEIGQNDTGKINLSMWNSQNTQGSFVKTDIK